ncbi:hypothetical protein [Streptomyces venezuelae]|uniref:hypothetical protein n=1 Tax=Streptomyces venezuelae TaxID=54571 RepID=UPI0034261392
MTTRRPLGTGPARDIEAAPVPRAQLAAERLPSVPAAADPRPKAAGAGRRVLGPGPGQ